MAPNVLFILMDNLGYGELGCYGGGILRGAATPNIDQLARDGTALLNINVEPQCTPSRVVLHDGQALDSVGHPQCPVDRRTLRAGSVGGDDRQDRPP